MTVHSKDELDAALEQFEGPCGDLRRLLNERRILRNRSQDPDAKALVQKIEGECRAKVQELNALQISVR